MNQLDQTKLRQNPELPIVMVDDSEIDIFIAGLVYKKSGLPNPLVTLGSGQALLDYLDEVKLGSKAMPATVLLDINMPGMNGFEALERIRQQDGFSDIPIIMIFSNSDSSQDRHKAIELGADGFRTKPADLEVYAKFLQELVA